MNYVVQTTANLVTPNWVTASNAVTVNAVTVTNSAPAGYFRLLQSTNPTGMVLVPAGSFIIGNYIVNNFYNAATNDPDITDANPTNVYVSAFYMDVNLVSSNQWAAVYSYATGSGYTLCRAVRSAKAGNNPVQTVDWYDCVAWCNARSVQAGLTPCYYTDAGLTQVYTNATGGSVYLNMANNGYRLPTEAEWEKAARGGVTGNRFPWGNQHYCEPSQLLQSDQAATAMVGIDMVIMRTWECRGNESGDESGGVVCTERVWPLRHGRKCCGVVLGLVCHSAVPGGQSVFGSQQSNQRRGQDRASVCCAAAIGTATPASRGAPFATTNHPYVAVNGIGFRCVRGL